MMYITSAENKIYKQAKKLLTNAYRAKTGLFLAEGERIVSDATHSGAINHVIVSQSYNGQIPQTLTYHFSDSLFSAISETQHSQGIIAVCNRKTESIDNTEASLLLICDGVCDPGNLGTIIRTAECAGAGGVVLLTGCVDAYNPKVVRATMGSIFRVPLFSMDVDGLSALCHYDIVAATLGGAQNLFDSSFKGKTAVIIGNEAHGISPAVLRYANKAIKIPMCGSASS
ncbi:MAG: RNA methyltransferase, partial [Clostridiaceae bacterium]|nr:RNA methyltransferase [Clostridiaceae bacterium]